VTRPKLILPDESEVEGRNPGERQKRARGFEKDEKEVFKKKDLVHDSESASKGFGPSQAFDERSINTSLISSTSVLCGCVALRCVALMIRA
jgi:hypothetical protein